MSWGTDFKADIFLSKQSYSSIAQIESAIDDCDETIQTIQSEIKMYASSTPKDVCIESDNPINYINSEVDFLMEELEATVIHRYKLMLYLEAVKENPKLLQNDD